MSENKKDKNTISRRKFLTSSIVGIGSVFTAFALTQNSTKNSYWQIDPQKCIECERCSTECVLALSAVKCMHVYEKCGYCDLCSGYFKKGATTLDTAAENQLCPTGALKRTFIEEPYFEYMVDEKLCIGCGRCVKNCRAFGNASLVLQIRHDICVQCNECRIATACPAQAIQRVSNDKIYLLDRKPLEEAKS